MQFLRNKLWLGVAAPGALSLLLLWSSVGELLAQRVTEREAGAIVGGIICNKTLAESVQDGCDPNNCPTTSYYAVSSSGGTQSLATNQLCPSCNNFGRYSSAGCNTLQ